MTKKIITLLSTALLFCNSLFAQLSGTDTFQLEKNTNGHYIFKTKINHQLMATIFLESGIHVMLIDSLYAFENSRHLNLDFVKTKRYERMNLGGRKYKITHKATGTIQLGDNTKYSGEIFVLSNYHSGHDMAIPIQRISHSNDGAHIIKLDMKNYRLQVLNRKLFSSEPTNYNTITINYDTYQNMPAVRTDLCFKHKGKRYTLSGNFVLDLGNASFLFLMKQNPAVQDFLKNNTELKIQTAYNKKGVPVGEAIVAEQANFCKKSFKQQIIAITPALPKFTTEGCIGLKFFDGSISVFDFDKHEFHFQ